MDRDQYMQNTSEEQQLADYDTVRAQIDNGDVTVEDGNRQLHAMGWF